MSVPGAVPASVVWLPLLLIPQILFTAGLAWILAATGVYVRDLGQISGYLLTLWFFLTPICYPESQLPPEAISVLRFNPLFVLVKAYRAVFLEDHAPTMRGLAGLWIVGAVVAVIGYAWFHRLRKSLPSSESANPSRRQPPATPPLARTRGEIPRCFKMRLNCVSLRFSQPPRSLLVQYSFRPASK